MNKKKQFAPTSIDSFSCASVQIFQMNRESRIGRATGFYVKDGTRFFLITNWHVVTALNPNTGEIQDNYSSQPTHLKVFNHSAIGIGSWIEVIIPLYNNDGSALWIEHPLKEKVDIVAIEVAQPSDANCFYFPIRRALVYEKMVPRPAMPVFVVGFPLGMAKPPCFPIWKTGHIATDPELDYQDKPCFIIDATTRGGMSGSPVFLRLSSGFETVHGAIQLSGFPMNKFLGIYSGRVNADLELGFVWKPQAISEVLGNAGVNLWTNEK